MDADVSTLSSADLIFFCNTWNASGEEMLGRFANRARSTWNWTRKINIVAPVQKHSLTMKPTRGQHMMSEGQSLLELCSPLGQLKVSSVASDRSCLPSWFFVSVVLLLTLRLFRYLTTLRRSRETPSTILLAKKLVTLEASEFFHHQNGWLTITVGSTRLVRERLTL